MDKRRKRKTEIVLHKPGSNQVLRSYYERAFRQASELFIVTAYLTEWDVDLKLNNGCKTFRIIIGKDFGITRKAACKTLMRWLPPSRQGQFLAADGIEGFHPKAVFWLESNGASYAIVGSSNLTRAAFETNYEANAFFPISCDDYASARRWVREIEKRSVPVSEDWLEKYKEAPRGRQGARKRGSSPRGSGAVVDLILPTPPGMTAELKKRRSQLSAYKKHRAGLIRLFKKCASGKIASHEFYDQLPAHWSYELDNRLQGRGWEISGKNSDFQALSKSYIRILKTAQVDRDDIVVQEIDSLAKQGVETRRAFLSEMLCLEYPDEFPVWAKPVRDFLSQINFRPPRRASEGVRYLDLAKKFRLALMENPRHPANNLAELDMVIWLAYGRK